MELTFKEISSDHLEIIENFECTDEPSVSLFLREQALKYHELNMARTRLYFDENHDLVGYFTVYNDLMELSNRQKKKHRYLNMPPKERFYPAIKLHYLGIDSRYRGQGYGRHLLLEALTLAVDISKSTGCVFLTLEALKSSIPFYFRHAFLKLTWNNDGYLNMFYKLDEFY